MATEKISAKAKKASTGADSTPKEKHFCMACGKEFEAKNALVRYCPECAEKRKKAQRERQQQYVKERAKTLGLVNVTIYRDDKEKLAKMAKEQKITMAEALKALLAK